MPEEPEVISPEANALGELMEAFAGALGTQYGDKIDLLTLSVVMFERGYKGWAQAMDYFRGRSEDWWRGFGDQNVNRFYWALRHYGTSLLAIADMVPKSLISSPPGPDMAGGAL